MFNSTIPIHWGVALALVGVLLLIVAVASWTQDYRKEAVITAVPAVALLAAFVVDVVQVIR